ncbi:MFS transporter [Rhizobiales bacterium]|uniref:MFS transporter n=1 Tax=Hongsoonwoonella zoysiae TaxID=2821844 RepID=UPI0015608D46|nr:MFS transporter [Hongsoonwoonella zoysiae]NRG19698.1 MFS transporter [Hongsoonwoonella zoysiae]
MAQTLAPIAALLLSVGLVLFGHGLQTTLLPLAANLADFTDIAIGVLSSGYYIGFVVGCLVSPYVIMRAGHIRAFAAIVSLMSAAAIIHPIVIEPFSWTLIRFVSGLCLSGFYLIVESWLNEHASNANRGAVMSVYIVILYSAMTLGQLSLTGFDISTFVPFAIASVAVSVAVIPISMTRSAQPAPITLVRFRPIALYRNSPAAMVGGFVIGMGNAAIWTLSPLYASDIGLDTKNAAYFASAVVFGGAVAQWPIGRLSDRMDRRYVLVAMGTLSALAALFVVLISPTDPLVAIALAGLMGILTQPTYAVAVAHGFDHAETDAFVETSSGLLLANGIGSVIGPFAAAFLMDRTGANGLFYWMIGVESLLAIYVLWRLARRSAVTAGDRTDYEYATTAQLGAIITPDPLDVEDPNVIPPEEFPAYEIPSEDENAEAELRAPTEERVIERAGAS